MERDECHKLADAAEMLLRMRISEYKQFEARTAAEAAAMSLVDRTMRGDVNAFHILINEVDSIARLEMIIENEDALSRSLRELAEQMGEAEDDKVSETV